MPNEACSMQGCGGEAVASYEAETGVEFVVSGRFGTGPASGMVCAKCLERGFCGDGVRSVIVRYENRTMVFPRVLPDSEVRLLESFRQAFRKSAGGGPWVVFCALMDAARKFAFEESGLRIKSERPLVHCDSVLTADGQWRCPHCDAVGQVQRRAL